MEYVPFNRVGSMLRVPANPLDLLGIEVFKPPVTFVNRDSERSVRCGEMHCGNVSNGVDLSAVSEGIPEPGYEIFSGLSVPGFAHLLVNTHRQSPASVKC